MEPSRPQRPQRSPFMLISAVFGMAWVMAAWARPEVNFVLFPFLIAGSLPIVYRLTLGRAIPTQFAAAAAVAGITNVIILAAFLAITDRLNGPTVLAFGGPVLDATMWGVIGAGFGVFAASWKGPRRL